MTDDLVALASVDLNALLQEVNAPDLLRVDSSDRRNAEIDRGVRWTWWNKAMGIIGGMFLRASVSSS